MVSGKYSNPHYSVQILSDFRIFQSQIMICLRTQFEYQYVLDIENLKSYGKLTHNMQV